MEATQFLVQWEEHPSHLATRLGYLLEHQSLVDVTLMCNTHTLKVHRAVLAACSPYFERQLGNHPLIVLKDMKFSVLKSLVEFMYCGETSVSEENLTPLLEAAKFFEVKGLSAMTKESVCTPSTPLGLKTFNGTSVTAPSGSLMGGTIRSTIGLGGASSSGIGRGRGRGRGRPPLNPTAKVGSPTESAQILLSLSNTTTNDPLAPVSSSSLPQSTVHQNQQHSLYKHPLSQLPNKTASSTPGENKLGPSKFGPYEPRRRGRKRGAVNSAFRDRLLREQDTHMVLENFKRDLTDDSESSSPLLSSLLTGKPPSSVGVGPDKTPGSSTSGPSDYVATKLLKEIGLPSNVPLLMDNGDGKLVTLTEEVLKSVGFDPEGQIHVQGPSLSDVKYKKTNNIVTTSKPLNHQLSLGGRINDVVDGCRPDLSKVKKELLENDTNDEELIQKLRSGAACEAQNDPDAVVLYEVTNDKNVQKFVLSAKEVESLKMLNAQLDKHKKELRDLQRQQESHMQQDDSGCVADGNGGEDKCDSLGSTTGTDSPSSRIAILKMKINEVKALLQQMMNIAQGIKPRNCFTPKQEAFHTATDSEMLDVGDSVDLQMNKTRIVYEFVDNNGEKIDGYQPRGNVPDKKENKDEFMGLFEMVCDSGENPGEEDVSPLLSESGRVVRGNSTEPSPRRDHHSSTTFHVLEDDDVHDGGGETISYEIDGMMNDEGHNIVIEGGGDTEVGGDVKDTEEDGTSSDFKYIMNVVYDSDHVIYDTAALPSATQEEDTAEYIVYSEEDASRHHHVDDSHHPDDGVGKSDVITGVQHSEMMSGVDFVELDDDRTDETHLIHRENSPPVKKPRLQVDPL